MFAVTEAQMGALGMCHWCNTQAEAVNSMAELPAVGQPLSYWKDDVAG